MYVYYLPAVQVLYIIPDLALGLRAFHPACMLAWGLGSLRGWNSTPHFLPLTSSPTVAKFVPKWLITVFWWCMAALCWEQGPGSFHWCGVVGAWVMTVCEWWREKLTSICCKWINLVIVILTALENLPSIYESLLVLQYRIKCLLSVHKVW